MKVLPIFLYNEYRPKTFLQYKTNKSAGKNTIQFNNIKQYHTLPSQIHISFGKRTEDELSFEQKSISQLINEGYEVAKIKNNKITNRSKYIIITDKDSLIALANSPKAWDKDIVMSSDIDMKDEKIDGLGSIQNLFTGSFDGNGYKITNLEIKTPLNNNVGFIKICDKANIKNLTLENVRTEGKRNVGCVAGIAENGTRISNVHVKGSLAGETYVGGIAGSIKDSVINGCSFDGRIEPLSKIVSEKEDNEYLQNEYIPEQISYLGGITGIAIYSEINAAKSLANITGDSIIGGLSGLLRFCRVRDCYSNPILLGENKIGTAAGIIQDSEVRHSYLNNSNYNLGICIDSYFIDCLYNISALNENIYKSWNKEVWNISDKKMPRLKHDVRKTPPVEIFIQDVQNDVLNNNIYIPYINYNTPKTLNVVLPDMEKPKHSDKNKELLEEINRCKSHKRLARLFAYWTNGFRYGFNPNDKEHDEILLALVRNPHFELSKRYESGSGAGEAVFCTPLYVLSRLNKGYIFREALEREDIDPFVQNGYDRTTDIFSALYNRPITTNMFLLFNSENPTVKKYIQERLANLPQKKSEDFLTNLLCRNSKEIIKYNPVYNTVDIPMEFLPENMAMKEIHFEANSKFNTLSDILNSPSIPINYTDSNGNTIAHVISDISGLRQIEYFKMFISRGGKLDNKNSDGKTPLQLAMEKQKHDLYTEIALGKPADLTRTDSEGNNVLMLNVKYNMTNTSTFNIDNLHKKGFSVNTTDSNGSTPLMEAIKNNDIYKINYLLSNGAAVDICDNNGQTALHHAFIQRNVNVIKWLLDQYAYPCIKDALGYMPKDYWPDCQKELLECGIDIDAIEKQYELSIKASELDSELAKELTSTCHGPWDEPYYEELIEHVSFLKTDRDLSQTYFNMHNKGCPIYENTLRQLAEFLIQTNSPYALEVVTRLYKDGYLNINEPGKSNQTLLTTTLKSYYEAENIVEKLNNMKLIKFLLDNNANIDISDKNGQTSLHHCIFTKNIIIFSELLGKHPNINATDALGKSPLFYLGDDVMNPMRIVFEKYAEKRKISLPEKFTNGLKYVKKI